MAEKRITYDLEARKIAPDTRFGRRGAYGFGHMMGWGPGYGHMMGWGPRMGGYGPGARWN